MSETKITNEQIATEVMGWKKELRKTTGLVMEYIVWLNAEGEVVCDIDHQTLPDFLADLNASDLVVKQVQKAGWHWTMDLFSDGWYVELYKTKEPLGEKLVYGQYESLCVAICTAALKAVRG